MLRASPAPSGAIHRRQRWWCCWPDAAPNAEAAARHEPKPYASPPPKSVLIGDDFAIVPAKAGDAGAID